MSLHEKWTKIAARINGFTQAAHLITSALQIKPANDSYHVIRSCILPELRAIRAEIERLSVDYGEAIPDAARSAIDRYLKVSIPSNEMTYSLSDNLMPISALVAFCAEFTYLISDDEIDRVNRSELAFEHLRRLIAVDQDVQKRWKEAFGTGETACERLGAVHLLSHGIWAFKIAGPRAVTDLVYDKPFEDMSVAVERTARALVLTEWKLVRRKENLGEKAREAREQIKLYQGGVLAVTQLTRTRYVILIKDKIVEQLDDTIEGDLTYRHVQIAVNPLLPSVGARQARRGTVAEIARRR